MTQLHTHWALNSQLYFLSPPPPSPHRGPTAPPSGRVALARATAAVREHHTQFVVEVEGGDGGPAPGPGWRGRFCGYIGGVLRFCLLKHRPPPSKAAGSCLQDRDVDRAAVVYTGAIVARLMPDDSCVARSLVLQVDGGAAPPAATAPTTTPPGSSATPAVVTVTSSSIEFSTYPWGGGGAQGGRKGELPPTMQLPPLTLRIPHPPPNHQGDGSIVTRAPLGQLLASAPSGSDKGLAQTFVERAHTLPDLASVLDATAPLSCPLATALAKDVRGVGCSRGGGAGGWSWGGGCLAPQPACLPACLFVRVCVSGDEAAYGHPRLTRS